MDIGNSASALWRFLSRQSGWRYRYSDLAQATGLSHRALDMAIGWLARAEQVIIEDDGDYVSLPPELYY